MSMHLDRRQEVVMKNDQDLYNAWFREMVQKHCPKLFHEIEERQYQDDVYLVGVIKHPSNPELDMHVSTLRCELTPFYYTHHCHLDMFDDQDHEEAFTDLIEWIQGILSDEILISTRYRGTKVTGGGHAPADHDPFFHEDNTRVEITSWSGKLDRIIEHPKPKRGNKPK
jgi:hypothetical protein